MQRFFGLGGQDSNSESGNSLSRKDFLDDDVLENQEDSIDSVDGIDDEIGQISLDVLESYDSVYILAPVAGIRLEDIDISVHETTLTISGERKKPEEFLSKNFTIKSAECFWGKFMRKIILPDNMDFSQIRAVMEDNLLVIHIPKIRFDTKQIKINKIYS